MRKILQKIVCLFLGHLTPWPIPNGDLVCYRCHTFLGIVDELYGVAYYEKTMGTVGK